MLNKYTSLFMKLVIATVATILFSGCATPPKIYINEDPAADFSGYRTYDFEDELGTDRSGYSSLLSQYLKNAVSREMETRGYSLSDNPDLFVNFYLLSQDKIKTTQTPSSSGAYYGYRGGRYNTWGGYSGTETRVTQYTEGTLNIDLVEAKRDQLVWEGTLVGKITEEVRNNLEPIIGQAVAEIFKSYPYSAGGVPSTSTPN